ncbi:MAG: hypothetical protein ACYC6F_17080 [Longimicrobiales bacterium]
MATTASSIREDHLAGYSPANLGLVGQVATSWGLSGGLLAGAAVSALMMAGSVSASIGFLTTTIFFVGGALIGFLHGGLVGYLGRPEHVCRLLALRRLALAVLYAIPTMLLGWCLAMCITVGSVGFVAHRPGLFVFALVGWSGLAAALIWAFVETHAAVEHLGHRWAEARAALTLLGLAFIAILPFFLVARPEILVIGGRPTPPLAVMMAAVTTAWIGGPLAVIGVLTLRAWRKRHPLSG